MGDEEILETTDKIDDQQASSSLEQQSETDPSPQTLLDEEETTFRRAIDDEEQSKESEKTLSDDEDEEESKTKAEELSKKGRLPGYTNAHELLSKELPARAAIADQKLRSNLVGSIIVKLSDAGQSYLLDWTTEEIKSGGVEPTASADCFIEISAANLMSVAKGDLNPQIAMLSDKVSVKGKVGLAIYFFNLIAPRYY